MGLAVPQARGAAAADQVWPGIKGVRIRRHSLDELSCEGMWIPHCGKQNMTSGRRPSQFSSPQIFACDTRSRKLQSNLKEAYVNLKASPPVPGMGWLVDGQGRQVTSCSFTSNTPRPLCTHSIAKRGLQSNSRFWSVIF